MAGTRWRVHCSCPPKGIEIGGLEGGRRGADSRHKRRAERMAGGAVADAEPACRIAAGVLLACGYLQPASARSALNPEAFVAALDRLCQRPIRPFSPASVSRCACWAMPR